MPRRTSGRASVHFSSAWHMMAAFSVWCRRSTRPLAAGWWGVVLQRWIPHIFAWLWKSWDSNWRPWSAVIVCGQPKWDIHPENRARDTVSAVMSGMGKASGQHVKQSTVVRQYWKPAEGGTGPTRLIWMCKKWAGGRGKLPTGVRNFGVLAGLASSGPSAAVFLDAWPHEALRDEPGHRLNSGVAEGM